LPRSEDGLLSDGMATVSMVFVAHLFSSSPAIAVEEKKRSRSRDALAPEFWQWHWIRARPERGSRHAAGAGGSAFGSITLRQGKISSTDGAKRNPGTE
jgi:hypothetical protein